MVTAICKSRRLDPRTGTSSAWSRAALERLRAASGRADRPLCATARISTLSAAAIVNEAGPFRPDLRVHPAHHALSSKTGGSITAAMTEFPPRRRHGVGRIVDIQFLHFFVSPKGSSS